MESPYPMSATYYRYTTLVLGILFLGSLGRSVLATSTEYRWYAEAKGTIEQFSSRQLTYANRKTGLGYGIAFGRMLNEHWGIEVEIFFREMRNVGVLSVDSLKNVQVDLKGIQAGMTDYSHIVATINQLTLWSGMINLLYHYPMNASWSVYMGAGAGYGLAHAKVHVISDSSYVGRLNGKIIGAAKETKISGETFKAYLFPYQLMIGVHCAINPRWGILLGYRFFSTLGGANLKRGQNSSVNVSGCHFIHALEVGLRYQF